MQVPNIEQEFPVFGRLRRFSPRSHGRMQDALARARRFRHEVIEPRALELDLKGGEDPAYVDDALIAAASRERLFSAAVPTLFGGDGIPFVTYGAIFEELAAGCAGIANVIGVHGLALCTIAATGDMRQARRVCRALVDGEREGRPALLSTALTEPAAGTDMEDRELLKTARLGSEARPVDGGYRLSGRKVFISNGGLAETHVVVAPTDRARPAETLACFLVPHTARGFRVVRVEHKMGQKACAAAELEFDDCFVPEADRVGSAPLSERGLELLFGASRCGVGAFGAGVARGAFDRALAWARTRTWRGRPLVEAQWAQVRLTEMWRNARAARAAWFEALFANERFALGGFFGLDDDLLGKMPLGLVKSKPIQKFAASPVAGPLLDAIGRGIFALADETFGFAGALGAHAKLSGSDLAVANCHLAIELLGDDGLRHDRGVEKLLRDARLLQIYEGTNQLNTIEVWKRAAALGNGSRA